MSADPGRQLRIDAARNSEKILRAAREVYAVSGPDAQLEEIARHARVGTATLYRRFANKEELIRAALEQSVGEFLPPAIVRASAERDPLRGIETLLGAMLEHWSGEYSTFAAAHKVGVLGVDMSTVFLNALTDLMVKGQQAGRLRADLVADDMTRLTVMLLSLLPTFLPGGDGWKRYLALVLDGITAADSKAPLPAPTALPKPDARVHG